ncbi:UxaA family hydrolase [Rubellicoccus peritrichatus]|uniref:UxaA family hydrolase n=1 Tax=Rubellicoccus peritrichatus TaxID=3080537 RepID=A0AAQ3QTU4_9BACT|nr:UxaA family hydrolase [Puniceicoccus sp. CR14]WOO39768.1 UxaA family hydrolase [Puniceicoccus sp. CR14]
MSNWEDISWKGYLREDGRKGIRNLVLVIYTVECASFVAHGIANNEDDVHVIGFSGCYDNAYAIRMMLALARHPNIGAILSVGLGCEYTQPGKIADVVRESGRPAESFFIQENGGTSKSIAKGKEIVNELKAKIARISQVEMKPADLVVGCECGGSDATSGLAGNPVVGSFFDKLVDAGGTAVFEEIVELIGLKEILLDRAVNDEAKQAVDYAYEKAMRYCQSVQQWSASPGNFAGGLTTIEEKSLGAFAKSGSRSIQGILKVSQTPPGKGLWLLDSVPDDHFMQFGYTNPNDSEGILDLISTGAQIVLFVTGRGSVIGSPVAPLLKITGNPKTYENLIEDMDFNAGQVLEGKETLDSASDDLFQLIIRIAKGELSKPEKLGHKEFFIPYKHQDTPSLQSGCRA